MSVSGKIKLYGMGASSCTQRVLFTLFENNVDFDLIKVDLLKGEQKQPAHLARNPFGKVPAIEDGSLTLYESRAIAQYIDETRGGHLTPKDPNEKALMRQWFSVEQGAIAPNVDQISMQRLVLPRRGLPTDEAVVKNAYENAGPGLDILDKQLEGKDYIIGKDFTLADVFFLPTLSRLVMTPEKDLIESRKNISAWLKRVASRPSWLKTTELNELAQKPK